MQARRLPKRNAISTMLPNEIIRRSMDLPFLLLLFLHPLFLPSSRCQLVVNVRNSGGEIIQEAISANTTEETVKLEFRKPDGTLITQFIDYASEVQIFRMITMAEEERGQRGDAYHVLCHVIRFSKSDFISADAMSKLRQKNPGAIRTPEEDKGLETFLMDSRISIGANAANNISPHINSLCGEAPHSTYVREQDLRLIAKILNKEYRDLAAAKHSIPRLKNYNINNMNNDNVANETAYLDTEPKCRDVKDWSAPCYCQWEMCIGWYPCGLKYCRGKDGNGKVVSYRCGIKTCQKCRYFTYQTKRKELCWWDE